jgi:peptidyl-prolyl cis-trans isomerase D
MLQSIRAWSNSLVVKLMFGGLILSFGVWGIGDIFRNRGVDTTVATVGGRKIDTQEVNRAVQESFDQMRNMFRGAPIDLEQLKQRGFVNDVLERIVDRDLVDLESVRLGLALGDATVRQAILSTRAFQDKDGTFDRNLYVNELAREHKSESEFESELRADLVRSQLASAVISGVAPPAELVDALYRLRAERRVAQVATVPASAVPEPGTPSDADLAAAYDQHKAAFRVPELRSFSLAVLSLEDLAAQIKPADDKLRDDYQQRLSEFRTPERRRLQQILVPDEAKAKAAAALLGGGKDFAEVAKEVAGTPADEVDLDYFTRDDLPPKLGEAAFALKLHATTEPIQDELGWHILRVTDIKPEETKSFDAVKAQLAADAARDAAGDEIATLANQIDDKLAGGASFADIVANFSLKVTKVENVDKEGRDADGNAVKLPQPTDDVLHVAFETAADQTSQLTELGQAGYFLLNVDKVTPETFKALDAVRPEVLSFWQADQRQAALEKTAADIAEQVNGGAKLADLAAARKLTVVTSKPLQRSGGDPAVPPALVAKLFEAKPGTAVYARAADGYAVAVVTDVMPPDPAQQGSEQEKLTQQLTPALQDDLFQEFNRALRDRYPVTVNPDALAHAS